MATETVDLQRPALTKDRILRAAVALADEGGVDSISMRKVAQRLGVVPMALYRHVANKEELLDAMVEAVMAEIEPPVAGVDWKSAMRTRILSARRMLLRHPWAALVIESRTTFTPSMIEYYDDMIGVFLSLGFYMELTHHALHAMGSRMLGFTQELFDDTPEVDPDAEAEMYRAMAERYPNIGALIATAMHDDDSVVGGRGCDDQFEFEFALDLMLDGLERLRDAG
jgi:AcrR family transcriptional regulator